MAPESEENLTALKAEAARTRARVVEQVILFREKLNLSRRLRAKFNDQPSLWVGAIALAGIVLGSVVGSHRKH